MSVAATAARNATKIAATTPASLLCVCVRNLFSQQREGRRRRGGASTALVGGSQSALPFFYLINIENQYY
jgi:hypothetical protein